MEKSRKIWTEKFICYGGTRRGRSADMNSIQFLFYKSFFAVAAQCLRRTDILVKGLFYYLQRELLREFSGNFCFHRKKGEVKQERINSGTHRRN